MQELSANTDATLVKACMNLFDALSDELRDAGKVSKMSERDVVCYIECLFFFSLSWSIGGTGDTGSRDRFDKVLRELIADGMHEDTRIKLCLEKLVEPPPKAYQLPFPPEATVYDYYFVKEIPGTRTPQPPFDLPLLSLSLTHTIYSTLTVCCKRKVNLLV